MSQQRHSIVIVGAGPSGICTAIKLREAGFDAKYMNSGHSGWRAIGHPILTHSA